MPRGVPANGKRQPRAVPAAPEVAVEEAVAGSAVGVPDGDFASAEVEGDPAQADELTIAAMTDMIAPAQPPEMTAEQREIKQLRDQLARLSGKKDGELEMDVVVSPGDENNILIHFLEDGLTALGKVWFRGEEVEFEVGSQPYKDTFDRLGRSWLDLRNDDFAQVDRFGKVMFRAGPWPGKTYLDGQFEAMRSEKSDVRLTPPTEEELAAAEKLRQRRAAPRMPSQV